MTDTSISEPALAPEPIPRKVARERRRVARRYKYRWIRRVVFVAVFSSCLVAIPILTIRAVHAIRYSESGRFVTARENSITILPETPVALLVHVGRDRKPLEAMIFNVYAGGLGGNTTLLPLGLEMPALGSEKALRLFDLFQEGGTPAVARRLEGLLGISFTKVDEIDADGWTAITKDLAPLTVNVDDTVRSSDELTTFAKGAVTLEPSQVGDFLSARLTSETELSRLIRVKAFWQQLMAAESKAPEPPPLTTPSSARTTTGSLGNSGSTSVNNVAQHAIVMSTSPTDDVRQFLGLIAHGVWTPIEITTKDITSNLYNLDYYSFDIMELREPVSRVMSGAIDLARFTGPKVRVQDGTGDPKVLGAVIRRLDAIGAVVVVATDILPTSVQTSEIQYIGSDHQPQAAAVQQALHVGNVSVGTNPIEGIDVTVVLSADSAKELTRG